jgi:hypothetical protein
MVERAMAWAREITFIEAINVIVCICAVIGLVKFALWIEELQSVFPIRNR